MSDDKPNRRWFQFHLSTAVVIMLVAAGMIWPNVTSNFPFQYVRNKVTYARYYGWPVSFACQGASIRGESDGTVSGTWNPLMLTWIPSLIIDVLFYVTILSIIAFLSEYIIRRREASKT